MGLFELFVIAVGLAMDAFAVAMCKGISMRKIKIKYAIIIALFFGVFQGVMPLLGWLLATNFEKYIVNVDHWIAFVLLGFLGIKMLIDAFKKEDECCDEFKLDYKELTILAVATSIDALAVGITFAILRVEIVPAISLIGSITFALCLGGVYIGHFFGAKFKNKAEFAGGIILILMGTKILLEHLELLPF